MKRILAICLIALLSSGAHAIPWEVFNKIETGKSTQEVLSIAGNPNKRWYGECKDGLMQHWLYLGDTGERDVLVTFCGQIVKSVERPGFTK